MDPLDYFSSPVGGICDPNLNDGLSLQEMIDSDMQTFFDIGVAKADSGTEDLLLDDNFHTLEDDPFLIGNGFPSSTLKAEYASSRGIIEDFNSAGAVMVNPNNVMPTYGRVAVHSPEKTAPISSMPVVKPRIHLVQSTPSSTCTSVAPSPLPHVTLPYAVPVPIPVSAAGTISLASVKTLKALPPSSQAGKKKAQLNPGGGAKALPKHGLAEKENGFPKPGYSYSCLIALALKNSQTGYMSVSEIYRFMCEHFPYFKTAPTGWKNSVRHNLSLNKCFEKVEKPQTENPNQANQRKGCLWTMNPAKITKMEEEVLKWSRKDPMAIKKGMRLPHTLESLERGEMVKDYSSPTPPTPPTHRKLAHMPLSVEAPPSDPVVDYENESNPRTPASTSSSSSSQGYDSAGSDFVDIEGGHGNNINMGTTLPELSLQVSSGIYGNLDEVGPPPSKRATFVANYTITNGADAGAETKLNTYKVQRIEGGHQQMYTV